MKSNDTAYSVPGCARQLWLRCLTVAALVSACVQGIHSEPMRTDSLADATRLHEVTVISFKQQRDIRLEPVAASIVKRAVLDNRNVTGIKDLNSLVPNLFMPDYGSKLTSPVFVRGIGSKINSPSIGLYVDGIPYFEKSVFDFGFLDIDRIEVLRGPQGTLYGRNTMGGIINVHTRPTLYSDVTELKVGYGSYGLQEYSFSRTGNADNRFGYSLAANYTSADGYFTNAFSGTKADGSKSGTGRLRLDYKPTASLTIGMVASFDRTVQGGYPYAVADKSTGLPGNVDYNDYSSYRRSILTAGLLTDYRSQGYSIGNRISYQHFSDHQRIDQDFSPQSVYFARQDMRQHMLAEEFTIKSTSASRYKWIFGFFGFWQRIDNSVGLDYLAKDYSTLKLYGIPTAGAAVFHQSTFDDVIVRGLSFTVGLRYDYEHARNRFHSFRTDDGGTVPTDGFSSTLNFSQLTPKAAIQYMFRSGGLVYASVTKGYKTGGFNTSFDNEADRTFRPETSWNYEIGAKHPFLDDRLSAEFAMFIIDWRDQQIYQMLASQTGQLLRNAGRSQSKGFEVSLQGNPVNQLLLQLNYGYTRAVFRNYRDETRGTDYSGNRLPMVPAHTFSFAADYTFEHPCHLIDRLVVGADYSDTGRIWWKEDNKVSQKSYGLLNAKISASKSFARLTVWARNITGTRYTAYYFETGGKGLAQQGRPFTLGCNLSLHF